MAAESWQGLFLAVRSAAAHADSSRAIDHVPMHCAQTGTSVMPTAACAKASSHKRPREDGLLQPRHGRQSTTSITALVQCRPMLCLARWVGTLCPASHPRHAVCIVIQVLACLHDFNSRLLRWMYASQHQTCTQLQATKSKAREKLSSKHRAQLQKVASVAESCYMHPMRLFCCQGLLNVAVECGHGCVVPHSTTSMHCSMQSY